MKKDKLNIAVVGASGYTGEELIRLLIRHPKVNITCLTSRENAGKKVGSVYPKFSECALDFIAPDVDQIAEIADLAFFCLPHGHAAEYVAPLHNKGVRIIDISADFRLKSLKKIQRIL